MSDTVREGGGLEKIFFLGAFVDENAWILVGIGVLGMISVGLSLLQHQSSSGGSGTRIFAFELLIPISVLLGIGLSLWALITYASRYRETARGVLTFVTGQGVLIALFLVGFNLFTVTSVLFPPSGTDVIWVLTTQFLITGSLLIYGVTDSLYR